MALEVARARPNGVELPVVEPSVLDEEELVMDSMAMLKLFANSASYKKI